MTPKLKRTADDALLESLTHRPPAITSRRNGTEQEDSPMTAERPAPTPQKVPHTEVETGDTETEWGWRWSGKVVHHLLEGTHEAL